VCGGPILAATLLHVYLSTASGAAAADTTAVVKQDEQMQVHLSAQLECVVV
jgi:hypothetical protein